MRVLMIRHGKTKGNLEHRYVGCTDEPLLMEAEQELTRRRADGAFFSHDGRTAPFRLYVSPMRRCVRTAQILFPGKEQIQIPGLRECGFGEFEYRNYQELSGNAAYQRFIDSYGKSGFPGGEDRDTFQARCADAFEKILEEEVAAGEGTGEMAPAGTMAAWDKDGVPERMIVLVVHGGTIMALLDRYSQPHRDYYDWQPENGKGYLCRAEHCETGWRLVRIEAWDGA